MEDQEYISCCILFTPYVWTIKKTETGQRMFVYKATQFCPICAKPFKESPDHE